MEKVTVLIARKKIIVKRTITHSPEFSSNYLFTRIREKTKLTFPKDIGKFYNSSNILSIE